MFAATAVLTIAIGIGGSTAIFSMVNAVLLRPLPYHDPDRLVRIWESHPAEANPRAPVSAADFNDWHARSRAFDGLALFTIATEPTVLGIGSVSLQVKETGVSPNLFALLGTKPLHGRQFSTVPATRGPRDGTEIILSHRLWQRALGGNPGAVGRSARIEGAPGSTIVGIMPPGFAFPEGTDIWTPIDASRAAAARRDLRMYGAIGRLAANSSVAAAAGDLVAIAGSLAREHPGTNGAWTAVVVPLHESVVGRHRRALVTLFAAVALVVLVGCANVSNLLFARGVARRGELAMRAALGATRARIVRLLLAESTLLTLLGGVAGCGLAAVLLPSLIQLAGDEVPRLADARVSGSALAYCAAASLLAGAMSGLVPALRLSRPNMHTATGPGLERSTSLRADIRWQRLIVAGELAASVVLLVGAMLLVRTFVQLGAVDLGFNPSHVISIETRVPFYRTLAPNRWQRLAADTSAALQRLRSVPGVQVVSAASDLPLSGNVITTEVTLPGQERGRPAHYHRVSPAYFRTIGMTLLQGRDFSEEDASDLSRLADPRAVVPRQGAVIVNETAARAFWPSGNALGQFLATSYDARAISRRQVVGIVRDARSETRRGNAPAEVYVPYLEDPSFAMVVLVRTTLAPDRIVPLLVRELRDVNPDISTANVRLLDEVVGDSMRESRFGAFVVATFAAAALLLSAVGVFGVFAFTAAARVREIGIRMALGASRRDITRMFLRQAAAPIAAGVALGSAAALGLGRFIQSLLFGVSPTDALSHATAVCVLAGVALAASYLPVRRIVRTNPAIALRA